MRGGGGGASSCLAGITGVSIRCEKSPLSDLGALYNTMKRRGGLKLTEIGLAAE